MGGRLPRTDSESRFVVKHLVKEFLSITLGPRLRGLIRLDWRGGLELSEPREPLEHGVPTRS